MYTPGNKELYDLARNKSWRQVDASDWFDKFIVPFEYHGISKVITITITSQKTLVEAISLTSDIVIKGTYEDLNKFILAVNDFYNTIND